ncbi:MAG: single-stranded-DNA-specific exonuclease RecJ [Thermostichales cyanobacterium GMQP_bins_62]
MSLPAQRWIIAPRDPQRCQSLAAATGIPELLVQVLLNRGLRDGGAMLAFREADLGVLPPPQEAFGDLQRAVDVLQQALRAQTPILICGDYDADGMTSTALLLRALRQLGGKVTYAIPSRMQEGYGLNLRIVQEAAAAGIGVLITVDNGIRAHEAVAAARALGLQVIITDHHALPEVLPQADAILNPQLLAPGSPYAGMAGVGVAYLLALSLAEGLGRREELAEPLLALCTLGTIADLAPLVGINRLWVKRGLGCLTRTTIPGIRALLTRLGYDSGTVAPETIGFGLGPRINAVGRIGDPQIGIDLLTTENEAEAAVLAERCEGLNQERQALCRQIEEEILADLERQQLDWQQERIVILRGQSWHHGVIGIVASHLQELLGPPVFLATADGEELRGSARGRPPFHVAEALDACADLLIKHGGHQAAGGFSLAAKNWDAFRERLQAYAQSRLQADDLLPQINIDAELTPSQLATLADFPFYHQLQTLQPFGIGNPEPIWLIRNQPIQGQRRIGKNQDHLRFQIRLDNGRILPVVAWDWGRHYPLPDRIDLAFTLSSQTWQGETSLQLQGVGIRASIPPLTYTYQPAPRPQGDPCWCAWQPQVRLAGQVLVYGYRRPQFPPQPGVSYHYDRPQAGVSYQSLVLWSLPPSLTHLHWLLQRLLKTCSKLTIYRGEQVVPVPTAADFLRQLQQHLQQQTDLDLLRLAQAWWVAPATVVAGLRHLGHSCPEFPATGSVEEELTNLERWYQTPVSALAQL